MKFLESTLNTRTIIQNSLQYIRSDVPNNLTDEEVDWLIYNNICTIVDLREDIERQQKKCRLIDDNMTQIIDTIIKAKTNVLYFCNAGKDRTGVVSAIILHSLGMSDDYIVEDYMKTKENFADALENFAKQCPEVDINVITPSERYMREFLGWLKER